MIEIPLERESKIPLYEQIARHLKKMIVSGSLQEGIKLPGSRELAFSLSVSRTTVIEAYHSLEDEGFLTQKGRSGAYICWKSCKTERKQEIIDIKWDMASGAPSDDLIPSRNLAKVARELLIETGEKVLGFPDLEGVPELRKELVTHAVSRGIPARWEDVFVTSGGREGLALSMAALKTAGVTRLWMEELTYPDAVDIARYQGLDLGVIPIDYSLMPEILSKLKNTDALYLVPSFQNPTGGTIPTEIRRIILENSMERDLWILEDDAYGELRYGEFTVPALKAMTGSERVIYLGSFSQALFPGLRLGYSLLPEDIMASWSRIQSRRSGPVSSLVQYLVMQFIRGGGLEEALNLARFTIASRMAALVQAIRKVLPDFSFTVPEGGIYLWLETPGLEGDTAQELAADAGIAVISGNRFSWTGKKIEAVRFSVSSIESKEMESVIRELKKAWSV